MPTPFNFRTFRQLLLRAAMAVAGAALSCGAGYSAEDVSLDFHEKDGHVQVEGSFLVEADQKTAWNVLTDYDHIPQFVRNMKVSHIQIREGNDVLLHQIGEGGFLFFTQKIRLFLHIQETPERIITFKDMAHKEFKTYEGAWTIDRESGGPTLKITYQLDAVLNFSAPAFLADDAMGGGAKDLLKSVRQQILLRQARANILYPSSLTMTQASQTTPDAVSLR